jgi:murein DD-endopeptidase MepM/ murein hydrolase activator NlpD
LLVDNYYIIKMNVSSKIKFSVVIFALPLLAASCAKTSAPTPVNNPPSLNQTTTSTPQASTVSPVSATTPQLSEPINGGLTRVTKKAFGLYVSPGHSPISPEKFTGFHTGIDFETTPSEQTSDVPIYAACNGKLLLKKYASGYGGVAVESCVLDGQNVTIIYGHLRLSSIIPNTGDSLTSGQKIAVLGTGYSSETDGERRHLHFGIHKGTAINILGYVQKQTDLSGWENPTNYLQ